MAYVDIPKDLTSVKTKVMFNLTKRQLICFGGGALIGVPLFFVLKSCLPIFASALIMIIAMLPFFMLAMYEKNGQPLEKLAHNFIQVRFVHPKQRPYRTDNLYTALERQKQLNKEVQAIVKGKAQQPQTNARLKTADRRGNRTGKAHR